MRRSRSALQHDNGNTRRSKFCEHVILRHHEAIPARQVFPSEREIFSLVGGIERKRLNGVRRIADNRLRYQLGAHGRPQTIGNRKGRFGSARYRGRGIERYRWVMFASRPQFKRRIALARSRNHSRHFAHRTLHTTLGSDNLDCVLFGSRKLHGHFLLLLVAACVTTVEIACALGGQARARSVRFIIKQRRSRRAKCPKTVQ